MNCDDDAMIVMLMKQDAETILSSKLELTQSICKKIEKNKKIVKCELNCEWVQICIIEWYKYDYLH